MGFQVMPEALGSQSKGLGLQDATAWTITGGPIQEILSGEVFTDGSCFKHGPPTWNQAGWAIVKLSRDGVVLGWMKGPVGRQLPQSSPASEHIAALALATHATSAVDALSDYKGLEHFEDAPQDVISRRQSIYSGVRVQIRARAPQGFRVVKVAAHVVQESCTSEVDRFRALGNDWADRLAKEAALETQSPTSEQLQQYHLQTAFLHRFLRYVPAALGRWPQVGPTNGKQVLPKRPGAAVRTGRASFVHDALGVLEAEAASQNGVPAQAEGFQDSSAGWADPPEVIRAPRPQHATEEGVRRHDWHWQAGRWICAACLTTSRSGVPPRLGKCAGMASNLASLIRNPRKHTLQIATFTDGCGVVVVCSRCGHYSTSNRPVELHKKDCVAIQGQQFCASPGAKAAYERICAGKHPRHAKGEAKILDPCMAIETLIRLGGGGNPS